MKINYISNFKIIWNLIGVNKKKFVLAVFLTFFKTFFSVIGSVLMGILLQTSFVKILELSKTETQPDAINAAFFQLMMGCLIILICYLFYGLVYAIVNKLVLKIAFTLGKDVRSLLFAKIHKIPFRILDSHMSGELLTRATLDVNVLALNFALAMGNVFTTPAIFVCTYIALFIISPYLALISIIFVFLGIFSSYIVGKKSANKFIMKQDELGKLNSLIEQDIENRKVIKIFGAKQYAQIKYNKQSNKEYELNTKAEMLIALVWPFNEFFQFVLSSFLYVIGIVFIYYKIPSGSLVFKELEVGTLTSFSFLALFFMSEMANALKLFGVVQKTLVSFSRVNEILKYEEYKDNGTKEINATGKIEFKNVCFEYEKNKPVLKDISFKIKPNQKVAIVGPTGSGKTTITNLLLRFYDVSLGDILIDDINLKDIKFENIQKNISLVLQDSFMFSETIFENIRNGKKDATEEEVIKAAKLANVHDFIVNLKNGYDSVLNKDIEFSQGQLQLLSIARAIISNSKILIMDEATSYVDTKTEKDIQNAILNASNNKTVIMIAHRLSTIKDADNIIVIHNGKIVEQGNHKQLIKNKGFYHKLHKANYVDNC